MRLGAEVKDAVSWWGWKEASLDGRAEDQTSGTTL